jgi:hypothetical protein
MKEYVAADPRGDGDGGYPEHLQLLQHTLNLMILLQLKFINNIYHVSTGTIECIASYK